MNYRERIHAALRGQPVDHIPWAPRWELFLNAARADGRLPEKYEGWDIFDITRDLGMGIKANNAPAFKIVIEGVETRVETDGSDTITHYDTPFGSIRSVFRITPELQEEGVRGLEMEYLIKGRDDYEPVYYLLEHTKVVETPDALEEYERRVGADGFSYIPAGPCPMHKIQREYTGYQQSYLELMDNLPQIERLIEMLQVQYDQIAHICADSPCLATETDGNFDILLHPPAFFERWFTQPLKRFGEILHEKDKLFITHNDGQMRNLLAPVMNTGIDVAEAWSPYPQTTVTTAQALQVWRGKVAIWGGLPTPVLCESFPEADFERYFDSFLREIAPGDRIVIGTGDNFPTDSSFERVRLVTRLVEERCKYPLKI